MNGYELIGELLRGSPAVTALVPAERIKAGRLPDNVALPALLIRTVSIVERHALKRVGWERVTARISVTVRAAAYRDQVVTIGAVRACCAGRTGAIGGAENVSILTAGAGPDTSGPANSFEQGQDFRVSFDAPIEGEEP